MVFNSINFFLFFLLVYGAYRLLGQRYVAQNRWLLLASYVFYGWWDWRFPALMGFTTLVDYLATAWMRQDRERRNLWLSLSLLNNLGVLFVLKYYEFFQANVLAALHLLNVEASPHLIGLLLPVGISFYTFQRITYVLDVYHRGACADVGLWDFALFVSFFPLLLSGPIERASRLLPQLLRARQVTGLHFEEGAWLVAWGLFKKMYVADNVASLVDPVFAEGWHGSGGEALVAVYAYAVQIYCDFSGYSDVARGLARLLGFDVMNNFNLPYFATNPSDFWRRWHISLSTWLRDYVYIPLGGSRAGSWATNRNLMVTMILVGLWHGAAWTFVFWGVYHGALLVGHRLWTSMHRSDEAASYGASVASGIVMFHLTCLGWLLFRATSVHQAFDLLGNMLSEFGSVAMMTSLLGQLLGYVVVLLVIQCLQWAKGDLLILNRTPLAVRGVAYGGLFYLTVLHGGTSNSFIYFQF